MTSKKNFILLAGPCVIESPKLCEQIVSHLKELCKELKSVLGESMLGVEMELMGPDRDMRIFTVLDEAAKATLGKKLDIDHQKANLQSLLTLQD